MSFVQSYSGASTPLPTEGRRQATPQPRALSRGRTNMSHGKKVTSHPERVTSHPDIGERVCAFLRAQHPVKTAEWVAAETGIPAETIAHWLKIDGRPSAAHLLALIGAYEAEFLVSIAPSLGKWLDPVRRERKLLELERRRGLIDQEIKSLEDENNVEGIVGDNSITDGRPIGLSGVSVRRLDNSLLEGRASTGNKGEAATAEEI